MTISIVIPTYNRPKELERLLESIKAQTYKKFEIIIVDDHSSRQDEYLDVINRFKIYFEQLYYYTNQTNRGAPYSRNFGILKSKYDLIALVDDDDEWLPQKLEAQLQLFNKSLVTNLAIVYTWTNAVDEDSRILYRYCSIHKGSAIRQNFKECFIPSPSVMVKKEALISSGLFDESLPSCQDWDMWTRIFLKGYGCDVVSEMVTIYHKHRNESIGSSPKALRGYLQYYKKYFWFLLLYLNFKHLVRYFKLLIRERRKML